MDTTVNKEPLAYDRHRLLGLIEELKEARTELMTVQHPAARLVSLAITDIESADNWLMRAMGNF